MNALKLTWLALFCSCMSMCSVLGQKSPDDSASQLKLEFIREKGKLIEQYDRNHNGKIDSDERKVFIDAIADLRKFLQTKFSHDDNGKPIATPAMRKSFAAFDKDHNGRLDSTETISPDVGSRMIKNGTKSAVGTKTNQ